MNIYQLIDSGDGLKFERFGEYTLIRPCPQALWRKKHPEKWNSADAEFSRETKNGWAYRRKLPKEWVCEIEGVRLKIAPTDFGHIGVFPEHACLWNDLRALARGGDPKILNLFAYSGAATLAFAQEGAHMCHLDALKGMVDWARENASLNNLEKAPIRWIVDDALKFLRKEGRREAAYDGIILDPPTFGRGSKGEVFKIENDLIPLLELCKAILSKRPRFVALSCHTTGVTPICLQHVCSQIFPNAEIVAGEMTLQTEGAFSIPSGSFVKILWKK